MTVRRRISKINTAGNSGTVITSTNVGGYVGMYRTLPLSRQVALTTGRGAVKVTRRVSASSCKKSCQLSAYLRSVWPRKHQQLLLLKMKASSDGCCSTPSLQLGPSISAAFSLPSTTSGTMIFSVNPFQWDKQPLVMQRHTTGTR